MTEKAARRLKTGTRVCWSEAGAITERGIVNHAKSRIDWPDGQTTHFSDDWAMVHVELEPVCSGKLRP